MSPKRAPSPGLGAGTNTASRRRAPSPGRNSPAPPGDILPSRSIEDEQKTVKFDPSPSQRFIFSKKASDLNPPSRMIISSMPGPEGNHSDSKPKSDTEPKQMEKEATFPSKEDRTSSSKKKAYNPLRNNPSFLQKFAQGSDSESDEELELVNNKASKKTATTKVSAMQKMKKIAAVAAASPARKNDFHDLTATPPIMGSPESPVKEHVSKMSAEEDSDFDSPVKFVDGPTPIVNDKDLVGKIAVPAELKEDQKSVASDDSSHLSSPVKHWNNVSQAPGRRKALVDGLKKRGLNSSTSLNDKTSSQSALGQEKEKSPESLSIAEEQSSAYLSLNTPGRRKSLVELKKRGLKSSTTLNSKTSSQSSTQSALSNEKSSELLSNAEETPSDDLSLSELSFSSKRRMTISDKLEKRRGMPQVTRLESESSVVSKASIRSGTSRRELLDKAKSRMSRSPSPSPLIKRHMPSPKRTVSKKSSMQKMIEAREKKSSNNVTVEDTSTISSKTPAIAAKSKPLEKHIGETESKYLSQRMKSVPSLVSAPSDEQAMRIARSGSSEHLSVRKGLNILQKQNAAMKNLPSDKPSPERKVSARDKIHTSGNLSANMTRLQVLKEDQRKRDAMRERHELEMSDHRKMEEISQGREPATSGTGGKTEASVNDDLSVDNSSNNNGEEDDDFSIDEFAEELPPHPSMRTEPMHNHSPWADTMEQQLNNDFDPDPQFDDHYEGDIWFSDGKNDDDAQEPQSPLPTRQDILLSRRAQADAVKNPVPFERNVSFQGVISSNEPEQSISTMGTETHGADIYVGAYDQLLARSTNPFLVRIYEPTLPSSLMTNNSHFLPVADFSNDQPFAEEYAMMNSFSRTEEPGPMQPFPPAEEFKNMQQHDYTMSNPNNYQTKPGPMQPFPPAEDMQQNDYTMSNPNNYQTEPAPMKSLSSSNSDDNYFVQPHNLVDGIQAQTHSQEEDSLFQESTLIGQIHVNSEDEETNLDNNPETVADWWQNSYAHTQDEIINSDIKLALSQTLDSISLQGSENNAGADSDDDVFYGLENSPNGRKSPGRKGNSAKRGLTTIMSEDSEFDEIMNNNDKVAERKMKSAPPPPPPPPISTPPNRASSSKVKVPANDIPVSDLEVGEEQVSPPTNKKRNMPKQVSAATRVSNNLHGTRGGNANGKEETQNNSPVNSERRGE